MARTLIIIVAFLIGPAAAHATRLYGVGTGTCANFIEQYNKQPGLTEIVYYSWFQGFLSSMNLALHANGKQPVDYETTVAVSRADEGFLHDYCAVHTDQQFVAASLKLIGNYQAHKGP